MFVALDIEAAVIKAGHRVVGFAGTAERAVAMADEMRPDLVLMDIRLPGKATASTRPLRSGSVLTSPP